jgi:hypothetical protein
MKSSDLKTDAFTAKLVLQTFSENQQASWPLWLFDPAASPPVPDRSQRKVHTNPDMCRKSLCARVFSLAWSKSLEPSRVPPCV